MSSLALADEKRDPQSILETLRNTKEWKVKYLLIRISSKILEIRGVELIKEISHISFTRLISLQIWLNSISSIEALPSMHLPSIKCIHLSTCPLSKIKTRLDQ
jgi:hypothetical protein